MANRNMSLKGFIHKANGKISAESFLSKHREWLSNNNEVRELTTPILSKVEKGELLPTPALEEIRRVVYDCMMVRENENILKQVDKNRRKYFAKKEGKFAAVILDAQEKVVLEEKPEGWFELAKSFDMPQAALRWVDRKLVDNAGCFGVIQSNGNVYEVVEREESLSRLLRQPKKAVCRRMSAGMSRLSFGVKAHQSMTKFSTG